MGLFGTDIGPDINIGAPIEQGLRNVGGALGFNTGAFGGQPTPQIPEASADLQNAIAHQGQSTYGGADQWSNQYMKGAQKAGGLLNTDQNYNKSLGGDFASTSEANQDALARRSANVFNQNLGSLKQKADFAGVQREIQQTNQAASNQINLLNLKNNIDTRVQAASFAADQARAQVLGQFIGGIGSIGGAAIANASKKSS